MEHLKIEYFGKQEIISLRDEIQEALNKIKLKYETIADLPILVLIKYNNYEITCYKNGKLIIRKCEIKEEAEKIANKIYEDAK